ncbi:hypothetical protein LEMLEM_LOCUS19302 [Lemmus lemmus]
MAHTFLSWAAHMLLGWWPVQEWRGSFLLPRILLTLPLLPVWLTRLSFLPGQSVFYLRHDRQNTDNSPPTYPSNVGECHLLIPSHLTSLDPI